MEKRREARETSTNMEEENLPLENKWSFWFDKVGCRVYVCGAARAHGGIVLVAVHVWLVACCVSAVHVRRLAIRALSHVADVRKRACVRVAVFVWSSRARAAAVALGARLRRTA